MNEQYLVSTIKTQTVKIQVYVLKPGQHFERFGGSRHGLVVGKTPSLIVSQTFNGSGVRIDTEHDVHNLDVWRSLFEAVKF